MEPILKTPRIPPRYLLFENIYFDFKENTCTPLLKKEGYNQKWMFKPANSQVSIELGSKFEFEPSTFGFVSQIFLYATLTVRRHSTNSTQV